MRKQLLIALLGSNLLLLSVPQQLFAQTQPNATEAGGYIPWFTVQNKALVVQTGSKTKALDKDVTLPNGTRLEYRTQSVLLTNGTRVPLNEGDMLSLNGEFIRKQKTTAVQAVAMAAPVVAVAPAPAPVATPEPIAAPVAAPAAFTYRPTAPANGKLKGVVELGASGFNLFIIRVDEKHNWKLEKSKFGNSLVMENMATEEDIRTGLKA